MPMRQQARNLKIAYEMFGWIPRRTQYFDGGNLYRKYSLLEWPFFVIRVDELAQNIYYFPFLNAGVPCLRCLSNIEKDDTSMSAWAGKENHHEEEKIKQAAKQKCRSERSQLNILYKLESLPI